MNIAGKILKNTSFIFASTLFTKIVNVFFIAYASRVLGPENFGIYALMGTFVFFFSYFTSFGIAPMGVREIARNKVKAEEFFNHILSIRLCFIFISYGLLYLAVNLLNYNDEIKILIYISAISIVFSTFTSTFQILYMAFEMMAVPSFVTALNSLLTAILGILALFFGYGLFGLAISSVLISVVGAFLSGFWIRKKFFKYRFKFNLSKWIDILKQALPFALITFFQQANRHLTILFLSKIPSNIPQNKAIGLFNAASSTSQLAMMVPASIRQAVLPTISANRDDPDIVKNIVDKLSKYIIAFVSLPLVLGTVFFSKEIVLLVFGSAYIQSAPALTLLGLAYALQAFNLSANVTLSSSRDFAKVVPFVVITTGINIALAIPLIYYYSYMGACMAVLLTMVIGTFGRYYLLKKIWQVNLAKLNETKRAFLSSLIAIALPYFMFFFNANTLYVSISMIFSYLYYLYYNGFFSKDELLLKILIKG